MTPERYQHVKRLFHEVCDLPEAVQAACLDRACAEDDELRAEVEALLNHDEQTLPMKPRISAAAALGLDKIEFGRALDDAAVERMCKDVSELPRRIGDYRIIRKIGQGGMGVVYEAEQDNPRRTIALKVIRPGVASAQVLRRFQTEAGVLGRLQHPGIAQIYEAGTAELQSDGGPPVEQPFFAMEYIDGETLDTYTADSKIGIRQRLELCAKICDAVQHAHQKGVIHRDLKPGNILVDAAGQPKILDFGVARITDSDVQVTTVQTGVGQLIGTIPYMSPEQVAGDSRDLDTRSDVYALGVISFQLLTGRLPYEIQNKPLHDAVRTIAEVEPTPLSSINRVFRGDVNTIVAKALEKDKERRYQSASDLAADIRRYLNDQPIMARPATTFYQVRKFVRRNRALVTVVVVGFFAMVGGLIHLSWERNRAINAERLARERLARIEIESKNIRAINDFFNDMLASADPGNDGRDVRVADVLDRAAAGLETRLGDQPEVEASLRNTIGATYVGLGLYGDAEPHLRSALETRRARLGENDPDTLATMMNLAGVLKELNQLDEAEAFVRHGLEAHRAGRGEEDWQTLNAQNNLADILLRQGNIAEAEGQWSDVLETQRRVLKRDDPLLLLTTNNLAQLLKRTGRPAEAEPLLREALILQREIEGDEHPNTLATKSNLAMTLQALGKSGEAETLMREIIEARRRTIGDHPSTHTSISNLSRLLAGQGRAAEAEPLAREALVGFEKNLGDEHRLTLIARNNLASLLDELGRSAEAEPFYQELLSAAERALPVGHYMQHIFQRNYGACLTLLERYEEAEPRLLGSFNGLKETLGADHRHTRQAIEKLIALYESWGHEDKAAEWRALASPDDQDGGD